MRNPTLEPAPKINPAKAAESSEPGAFAPREQRTDSPQRPDGGLPSEAAQLPLILSRPSEVEAVRRRTDGAALPRPPSAPSPACARGLG
jgi:hypothetical protein